jgi:hypothetical protein
MHVQSEGITPVRNGKNAETRTHWDSSSMNQTILTTKRFRMIKS